jgi:hypothetical protein
VHRDSSLVSTGGLPDARRKRGQKEKGVNSTPPL